MEIVSWPDIVEERLDERVTRKMFQTGNIIVTKWVLGSETSLPVHDHVCEQLTIVERGALTLLFPGEPPVTLREGEMIVIPPSKPHGIEIGPEGCSAMDLEVPIRRDLMVRHTTHVFKDDLEPSAEEAGNCSTTRDPYKELHGFLDAAGIKISLEKLKELPLDLLARYVYERECITMGQLRNILGIDKARAKELLRQWKHGDDHSEASLKRNLERLIILPDDRRVS